MIDRRRDRSVADFGLIEMGKDFLDGSCGGAIELMEG